MARAAPRILYLHCFSGAIETFREGSNRKAETKGKKIAMGPKLRSDKASTMSRPIAIPGYPTVASMCACPHAATK